MEKPIHTTKDYFKSLNILHGALFMGQLLFGSVIYYQHNLGSFGQGSDDLLMIFALVAPAMALATIGIGFLISNKRIEAAREKKSLKEKLLDYRTAMILKLALIEAPSLFAVVCFMLTGNPYFLILSALALALFIFQKPTRERVATALQLSPEEQAVINKPDARIG